MARITDEKKLLRVQKALGEDTVNELGAMSGAELKSRIVQARKSIIDADHEMKANDNYVKACSTKSLFESGKREVNKRQDAVTQYAFHLLDERGDASIETAES